MGRVFEGGVLHLPSGELLGQGEVRFGGTPRLGEGAFGPRVVVRVIRHIPSATAPEPKAHIVRLASVEQAHVSRFGQAGGRTAERIRGLDRTRLWGGELALHVEELSRHGLFLNGMAFGQVFARLRRPIFIRSGLRPPHRSEPYRVCRRVLMVTGFGGVSSLGLVV